jgi:hypothetical protein
MEVRPSKTTTHAHRGFGNSCITRYVYTLKGPLQEVQKSNGKTIFYIYDALNRLQELESSDLSSYNTLHQPILIEEPSGHMTIIQALSQKLLPTDLLFHQAMIF